MQWLAGLQRLGHDVYFVEKSGWPGSCYDPTRDEMSDDCSYGIQALVSHLDPLGLAHSWCYVDADGNYHGLSQEQVQDRIATADLFIDMGTHGSWLEEADRTAVRVLVDGDPGYTQMRAANQLRDLEGYHHYYSVGLNLGSPSCTVPTVGLTWRPIFDPVVVDLFEERPVSSTAAFSTVMAWQSYDEVEYLGTTYGSKDIEFEKFIGLPRLTSTPLELAIGGKHVPEERLLEAGWRIRNPLAVTQSAETFRNFVAESAGEFSVNKNFYVATNSGFFSERSAAYLASARPVVMQDTGFSAHLPCGRGLFAVRTVNEAAAAIEAIKSDHARHAAWARELAREHLDASVVLRRFLDQLGIT